MSFLTQIPNVDERALDEPDMEGFRIAHRLLSSNPKEALVKFRELAERGSMLSVVQLANAYWKGVGVECDITRAETYYRRAENMGSLYAYYALGRMLMSLNRTDEAISAFSYASAKGYPPAIHYLGRMYFMGKGVGKNPVLGRQMLERAARKGSLAAKVTLSGLLIRDTRHPWNIIRGLWTRFTAICEIFIVVLAQGPASERLA